MKTQSIQHPSDQVLAAYGLGKIDDAMAETVTRHLETCSECKQRIAEMSADSFVGRLREAQGQRGTPLPNKSLSGLSRGMSTMDIPDDTPARLAASGTYTDIEVLGRGGMGVVYKAHNTLMNRLEVLKVLNPALLDKPESIDRFLREIQAAAKLNHNNVVRAYAATKADNMLVFAMEYVPGDDLAKLIKNGGPLPVRNACYYVYQAALGLQHAHERGMVHRDVKPGNLILTKVETKLIVKVLDFGLAKATSEKAVENGLTGVGKMMGTPDYMAPEQSLDAASADIRADVYSLGCTLYYLLAGRPPFSAGSLFALLQKHHDEEATPLNLVRPEVPTELAGIVAKMMAKSPGRRFQTPGDVAKVLAPFVRLNAGKTTPELSHMSGMPQSTVVPTPKSLPVAARVSRASTPTAPSIIKPRPTYKAKPSRSRIGIWAGVIVGMLMLAIVGVWAAGVFKLKTDNGTIVLENVPKDATVEVDGSQVTIERDGQTVTIATVKEGPHRLKVVHNGTELWSKDVTISVGGERIRMRLEEPIQADKTAPTAITQAGDVWKVHDEQLKDKRWDNITLFVTETLLDRCNGYLMIRPNGRGLTSYKVTCRYNEKSMEWRVDSQITSEGSLKTIQDSGSTQSTMKLQFHFNDDSVEEYQFSKIPKTKDRSIYALRNPPNWFIKDDELIHDASQDGGNGMGFGDITWQDYDFEFEAMSTEKIAGSKFEMFASVRSVGPRGGMLIGFPCGSGLEWAGMETWSSLHKTCLDKNWVKARPLLFGQWGKVKIQVRDRWVKLYWNGELVAQIHQTINPIGCVALRSDNVSAKYRNIRVTSPDGKLLCDMDDLQEAMDAYVKVFGED